MSNFRVALFILSDDMTHHSSHIFNILDCKVCFFSLPVGCSSSRREAANVFKIGQFHRKFNTENNEIMSQQ